MFERLKLPTLYPIRWIFSAGCLARIRCAGLIGCVGLIWCLAPGPWGAAPSASAQDDTQLPLNEPNPSPSPAADSQATDQQIRDLIVQLGSPRFAERQLATRELWQLGQAAEPQLRIAATSDSAEIAARAKAILADFDYGIYPTTDRATQAMILAFRDGNLNQKKSAGQSLLQEGKAGTLIKLLLKEQDRATSVPLVQDFFGNSRFARTLITRGHDDAALEAFRLLHQHAEQLQLAGYRREEVLSEYLWLATMTGKLDAEVERLADPALVETDATDLRTAVRLLRAAGDSERAQAISQRIQPPELADQVVENLLIEDHQWQKLSDLHTDQEPLPITELDVPRLLTGLIGHRLAGQQERFQADLQRLYPFSDPYLEDLGLGDESGLFESVSNTTLFMITEFLLVNQQLEKGLEYLSRTDKFRAFDGFAAIDDYDSAFQALGYTEIGAETAKAFEQEIRRYRPTRWPDSNADIEKLSRVVEAFYQLGFHTEAISLYRALFAVAARYESEQTGALAIVGQSLLINDQKELFFELVTTQLDRNRPEFALECLFGNLGGQVDGVSLASFWWTVLDMEMPELSPVDRLKWLDRRLRPLLADDHPDPEFVELVQKIEREHQSGSSSWGDEAYLGYTYLLWNQRERAKDWLSRYDFGSGPSSDVALKLGDLYFEDGQFDLAAEAYLKAWRFGGENVSGLYLAGIAQQRGGKTTQAAQSLSLARKLMFSAEDHRRVATDLIQRDLGSEARPLLESAVRVSEFQSLEAGLARFRLVNLLDKTESSRAVNLLENQLLDVVLTSRYYPSVASYTYYAVEIELRKFRQHLIGNEPQQAAEAARRALAIRPCNATIAEEYLPELRALPQGQGLADELFETIRAAHLRRLEKFPSSGLYNNNLAWINSTNGKYLDEALKHAELAVKNEPDNPTYLDTLADVCFNLGQVERAIELMEKCLRINPLSEHYQDQMEKFRRASGAKAAGQ